MGFSPEKASRKMTGEPGRTPNTNGPLYRGVAGAGGVRIYGAETEAASDSSNLLSV